MKLAMEEKEKVCNVLAMDGVGAQQTLFQSVAVVQNSKKKR